MLIKGLPSFRQEFLWDNEDQYAEHLHKMNEQLSLVLMLKDSIFHQCFEVSSFQNSLVFTILSILHYVNPSTHKSYSESWKCEYIELLGVELSIKALKLAERILVTNAAPLLRATDICSWMRFTKSHLNDQTEQIILALLYSLFQKGIMMRKQLLLILKQFPPEVLVEDTHILCLSLLTAKLRVDEVPVEGLAWLALSVSRESDISKLSESLRYLSQLEIWEDSRFDLNLFVETLLKSNTNDDQLYLLTDLIAESNLASLKIIESAIRGHLRARADSRLENSSSRPNQKDEFNEFLNDKTFIRKHKEDIIKSALYDDLNYEDEYVDTYADDGNPTSTNKKEQPANNQINTRKNADNLSTLENQLMKAYIADPGVFNRSSKTRQTKARQDLCSKLAMSHEQVEGWALMFNKNPKKEMILKDFCLIDGNVNRS